LSEDVVADELPFLTDGLEGIIALITDGRLLAIELPATVTLEIAETAPAMKAASSSARTKPATLSTGLVVQVPEYLTPGEKIKVNTDTREFVSRA
jgi:elongation factor P